LKRTLKSEKLKLGLERLSAITNTKNFSFWGKIFGTKKDYNIVYSIDFNGQKYFPLMTYYWRLV